MSTKARKHLGKQAAGKAAKPAARGKGSKPVLSGPQAAMRERVVDGHMPDMPDMQRSMLVLQAIETGLNGDHQGQRSSVYKINYPVLFAMGRAHIVQGLDRKTIARDFADEIKQWGVTEKAVMTWLASTRSRYHQLHLDRVKEYIRHEESLRFAGDPRGALDILISRACPVVLRLLDRCVEGDTKEQYAAMRGLEVIATLCDTFAATGHREAQTDKIRTAIKSLLSEQAGARAQGKAALTLEQLEDAIIRAAGLTAERPPAKEAA